MGFARVDFAFSNVPIDIKLRQKWQGKIVQVENNVEGYSLDGYQDEGICLSAPKQVFRPLSESAKKVAHLLGETFWARNFYTEDINILTNIRNSLQK
jgi:hypothetical protein